MNWFLIGVAAGVGVCMFIEGTTGIAYYRLYANRAIDRMKLKLLLKSKFGTFHVYASKGN